MKKQLLTQVALFTVLGVTLLSGCTRGKLLNAKNALAPSIQRVIPESAQFTGGTTIAVIGSNFVPGALVNVGNLDCQNLQFVSDSTLICTTPAYDRPGRVKLKVVNPNQKFAELGDDFNLTDAVKPVAGATVTAGSQVSQSASFRTDYHAGFVGSQGSTTAVQTSPSFRNLSSAMAVRFTPSR